MPYTGGGGGQCCWWYYDQPDTQRALTVTTNTNRTYPCTFVWCPVPFRLIVYAEVAIFILCPPSSSIASASQPASDSHSPTSNVRNQSIYARNWLKRELSCSLPLFPVYCPMCPVSVVPLQKVHVIVGGLEYVLNGGTAGRMQSVLDLV